jgi:hypothetical protein
VRSVVRSFPDLTTDCTDDTDREDGIRSGRGTRSGSGQALDEGICLDPRDGAAYNGLAWILATCPDAKYRDGKRAVEAARRSGELSGWRGVNAPGTLAAACAEDGDFDAAVQWQGRANGLYPGGKEKADGEARLKLYQAKTPYRESKP